MLASGRPWVAGILAVFFIYKPSIKIKTAVIISACDMNERERRTYGRK